MECTLVTGLAKTKTGELVIFQHYSHERDSECVPEADRKMEAWFACANQQLQIVSMTDAKYVDFPPDYNEAPRLRLSKDADEIVSASPVSQREKLNG